MKVIRHRIKYTATRIKYSPTRIKSRNFLSSISYTGISKNDFYNENFILDVYMLLVKNLSPFSLSRKVSDKTKHEMVYMLWRECIPAECYRFICEEKNFIYLNGFDVGHPDVLKIVGNFIYQGKQNLRMLQEHLARYKDIYQYVCSHVFHELYTSSDILFKSYRDKQMIRQHSLATIKQITNNNWLKKLTKTNRIRSKPFMNLAKAKSKRWKNVRKNDWWRDAKKQKNWRSNDAEESEENRIKEGEMWNRLNELNGEFKKIMQLKKES